jgi:hypothetical protein
MNLIGKDWLHTQGGVLSNYWPLQIKSKLRRHAFKMFESTVFICLFILFMPPRREIQCGWGGEREILNTINPDLIPLERSYEQVIGGRELHSGES